MSTGEYPVRISAPDIGPYRGGNTGVDYVHTFDSGRDGPHVMVSAVVHGNELCGAIAVDYLFMEGARPARGRLTLGFMNVAAFQSFDPENPTASRFVDEDFNRLWTDEVLDGPRRSAELARAREVRPIVATVDYLLDVHSMQQSTVPLMMAGPVPKGRALARAIGTPEHVVCDAGHAAGRRMRDYGAFSDEASPRNALLVECGQHWEPDSVEVAKDTVLRFLAHVGAVDRDFVESRLARALPPSQRVIEVSGPVTITTDAFRFAAAYRGMEVIEKAGTVIGWDGDAEVRTPYDRCVLIMPSKRLLKGQSAVRFGRLVE